MRRIDLAGRRFGRLVALYFLPGDKDHKPRWLCRCDCGNECSPMTNSLTRGLTRSCGCQMHVRPKKPAPPKSRGIYLAGRKFGRLTLVEYLPGDKVQKIRPRWKCLCECGNETVAYTANIKSGNTTSCGCRKVEAGHELATREAERPFRRYCERCGTGFDGTTVQRFCSDECRDRFRCERLWPKRKHYCGICGDEFLGRAERRYCSDPCKRIASNRSALRLRNGSPQDQLLTIRLKLEQQESETHE